MCGGAGRFPRTDIHMTDMLTALENSSFSEWLLGSPSLWAYPTVLTLHTLGLGVLVGANWALDLRLLGVAPGIPLRALEKLFRWMWIGFWINAVSGVMLFAGTFNAYLNLEEWHVNVAEQD